jgi:hypothetical protein
MNSYSGMHSCTLRGSRQSISVIYNKLPKNIKDVASAKILKTKVREFLFNKTYYSVHAFLLDDDL